jgi:hypothetical protein
MEPELILSRSRRCGSFIRYEPPRRLHPTARRHFGSTGRAGYRNRRCLRSVPERKIPRNVNRKYRQVFLPSVGVGRSAFRAQDHRRLIGHCSRRFDFLLIARFWIANLQCARSVIERIVASWLLPWSDECAFHIQRLVASLAVLLCRTLKEAERCGRHTLELIQVPARAHNGGNVIHRVLSFREPLWDLVGGKCRTRGVGFFVILPPLGETGRSRPEMTRSCARASLLYSLLMHSPLTSEIGARPFA